MGKVNVSFRERALAEAARYGSDSWVFVRELLQNARDAGASRVELVATQDDTVERIVCRDNGCGMSAVHAHRYLFALYASSKEGDTRQAGQFGVGFWSVLRFKPDRVVIRSRPPGGDAWQVDLNHRLENAVFTSCEMSSGTEIVVERRRRAPSTARIPRATPPGAHPSGATPSGAIPSLAERVFEAAWQYGRFVTRRRDARSGRWWWRFRPWWSRGWEKPLSVRVNGRLVSATMSLPAPSATFHSRGFRGVVALSADPRVELFGNGLFVRQASCLEDLIDDREGADGDDGKTSLDLPGSLVPQVILDSSEIELLLARSDVRQTRHLQRMVKTARRELEGLIERQLEAVRPQPWFLPLWSRLVTLAGRCAGWRRWRSATWLVPMALAGILVGWILAGRASSGGWNVLAWDALDRVVEPVELSLGRGSGGGNLSDLGRRYLGPRVDPLFVEAADFHLSYQPASQSYFLAALVVEDPSAWESISDRRPRPERLYRGVSCASAAGCVTVRGIVAAGSLRLPVPTGHQLDPASLRLDGQSAKVFETASGEPLIVDVAEGGRLEYRTGPAAIGDDYALERPRATPAKLRFLGAPLRDLPLEQRVAAALERVGRLIGYDRSAETVREHRDRLAAGMTFAEAALAVGKGDCDVQNGVLVLLLREAGVPARLAVGYVGQGGTVAPGLHAWVEYLGEDRRWRVADVSRSAAAGTSPMRLLRNSGSLERPDLEAALAEALASSAEPAGSGAPAPWTGAFPGWKLTVVPASIALVAVALVVSRRRRRQGREARIQLGRTDLAALLGGALQHPGLARLPALTHGRFIPLIAAPGRRRRRATRAMSLHEARRRSAAGTLYASAAGSSLARRAAGRGLPVIDSSTGEGRVTGLGLGAIDLDEWSNLVERGTSSAVVRRLNDYLDSIGEDWRVALASPLSRPLKVVDLSRLGLGRRQVLIDPRSADFAAAGTEKCSDLAAFHLLDAVAEHLDVSRAERARWLSPLACRAVLEVYA